MTEKRRGGHPAKVTLDAELLDFYRTHAGAELPERQNVVVIDACMRLAIEVGVGISPHSQAELYIYAAYDLLAYWTLGRAVKLRETRSGLNKLKTRTIILLARAYELASGNAARRASASSGKVTGAFF